MDTRQFLDKYNLLANKIDADRLIAEFLSEMKAGLAGRDSSLAMIPAYVTADRNIPVDEPVIVIDAGGTNLRVACITFDMDNRAVIKDYERYPMPGAVEEVSATEFFNQLAHHLGPMLGKSKKIGFCFSYPAEISPELDGRLLRWTKEMKAPEVIGRFIGRGLMAALGPAGEGKSIVLLNDTVATLLAGKAAGKKRYGSHVGFILGTGTNIAYMEKNKNILKIIVSDASGSQAINVESGGFSKAPRSDIDNMIDQASENPGINQFEKMISGRYLPEIVLRALKKGAEEGLLDTAGRHWIDRQESLDHEQMDALFNTGGSGITKSTDLSKVDRDCIQTIANAVIDRAAKLAAINMAATVIKVVGESSDLPVCINIDGSTYYKAAGLRENAERYLKMILRDRNIQYDLVHVERAPMIGAAIAGLVN